MRVNRLALAGALSIVVTLTGCDTEEELLKQRLAMLNAEETALQELKTYLQGNPNLEGPGAVSIFLSKDMLNSVLKGADGVVLLVPQVKGATVTLKSVQTDFRLGFPLLLVNAVAKKEDVGVELELVGAAHLEPVIEPGSPQHLALRVQIDSLVPRVQWGIFNFRLGRFVRNLIQVKVTDELRTAGVIRMPIESDIPLKMPAKQSPFSFAGAKGHVATPELSINGQAVVTQIVALPDGLHVYGKISMQGKQ